MRNPLFFLISLLFIGFSVPDFKTNQLRHKRVRTAYNEKEATVKASLDGVALNINELEIYIRIFKKEKLLELWGKNKNDDRFIFIKKYDICKLSGRLGPKRKQGDLQIPEGFYRIDRFNPWSNFYLSLGINYPNKSDRLLGVRGKLGGNIFIHGDCVTIGCVPITNENIKELYIYCVEAKNNGQARIPVSIYPAKLTDTVYKTLTGKYEEDKDKTDLWSDLKEGFDHFEENHQLPSVTFLSDGSHKIESQ